LKCSKKSSFLSNHVVVRDILVARVAAGKKVIPEIYERYPNPAEELLTLAQNTYDRKAGGRI
jgi:hypothetical protein